MGGGPKGLVKGPESSQSDTTHPPGTCRPWTPTCWNETVKSPYSRLHTFPQYSPGQETIPYKTIQPCDTHLEVVRVTRRGVAEQRGRSVVDYP